MTNPMCVSGTPVEHHPDLGLWVKREDLCCPGGPNFSKTRGVYAHVAARPERVIGVLDTSHSQGGWAVARACQLLGKKCVLFYPIRKAERRTDRFSRETWDIKPQQKAALHLGATLTALQAGRSAVLYHAAKSQLREHKDAYMMPNALKLPEMISETVAEVLTTPLPPVARVIISASSGTIAAGVISGLCQQGYRGSVYVLQGYSRSQEAMRQYMSRMVSDYSTRLVEQKAHPGFDYIEGVGAWANDRNVQLWRDDYILIDEGYSYADAARPGGTPPWPCNEHYDLKAYRWWEKQRAALGEALLWNVG